MFQPRPARGWLVIHFLAQQLLVTFELLLARRVSLYHTSDLPWYRQAIIPVVLGFSAGYVVQIAWKNAYFTGRFVWILPALLFALELADFASQYAFSTTIAHLLNWPLTAELMVGAIAYSLGITAAHSQTPINPAFLCELCASHEKVGLSTAKSTAFPS
jgi:hypothetical protein